ncbi:MAG: hypothetical protein JWN44_6823 [Myxococcales bacterium]|nr:hypothetical protein [Myxococcales bacterium]
MRLVLRCIPRILTQVTAVDRRVSTLLEDISTRFVRGELSPPIALMRMLIAAEDVERVGAHVAPYAPLRELLASHRDGCARICAMLASGVDSDAEADSVDAGLAFARRLFDYSVEASEESSVALYSLGSPELLAAATAEVVALLDDWALLQAHARCLEIGCGIGRFQAALGPRVQEARGLDLSARMIAAARRRCATVPNVAFDVTDGRDLSMFAAGRFELVYAVDSFPYLVQAGMALVDTHFAEAHRVLVAGGCFVLLNFSYHDDLARDRRDIAQLADAHGFAVETDGELPFHLWDGAAWRLRKIGR